MKDIILHLIREDIKQTRFIQQLNNLGLSADEQLLNLSPIIFDLMELDRSTPEKADMVNEHYMWIKNGIAANHSTQEKHSIEAILDHLKNNFK